MRRGHCYEMPTRARTRGGVSRPIAVSGGVIRYVHRHSAMNGTNQSPFLCPSSPLYPLSIPLAPGSGQGACLLATDYWGRSHNLDSSGWIAIEQ